MVSGLQKWETNRIQILVIGGGVGAILFFSMGTFLPVGIPDLLC